MRERGPPQFFQLPLRVLSRQYAKESRQIHLFKFRAFRVHRACSNQTFRKTTTARSRDPQNALYAVLRKNTVICRPLSCKAKMADSITVEHRVNRRYHDGLICGCDTEIVVTLPMPHLLSWGT